jgi:murein DD-endopeptidase MepM/ murein hydrolase activator NlpD
VEHQWDGCPYYSLYAHLAEIVVEPGMSVRQGQKIAVVGYTGRGIDRERAHLHLEVNLLINENFQTVYGMAPGPNQNAHGNFNGANLRGLDVARLYKEARANPKLTIPSSLPRSRRSFMSRSRLDADRYAEALPMDGGNACVATPSPAAGVADCLRPIGSSAARGAEE